MKGFGVALGVAAAAALGGCSDSVEVTAVVSGIQRTCEFITKNGPEAGKTNKKDCASHPDWRTERARYAGRALDVVGEAVVTVYFVSPADQQTHEARLTFSGRQDEFYTLDMGDELPIRYDPANPAHAWKA